MCGCFRSENLFNMYLEIKRQSGAPAFVRDAALPLSVATMRAPLRNGIVWPCEMLKKSPSGTLTAGLASPSQHISRRSERSIPGLRSLTVSQMRCTMPVPLTSSRVALAPASIGSKA